MKLRSSVEGSILSEEKEGKITGLKNEEKTGLKREREGGKRKRREKEESNEEMRNSKK